MTEPNELIKDILECTACHHRLRYVAEKGFVCTSCNAIYPCEDGSVILQEIAPGGTQRHPGELFLMLKEFFKKFPRFYYFLVHLVGAVPLKMTPHKFVKGIPRGKRILNVGSGPHILRDDVINLDAFRYPGVSIVSPAQAIPLASGSIDAIVCDNLLEHVPEPKAVLREMQRVLKPGGVAFIGTPFIIGVHASPVDFYRWTDEGLRLLCKDFFEEKELGIAYGPTGGTLFVLQAWLALLLSFNIRVLYDFWQLFFMALFIPLRPLDWILCHYSLARVNALNFYYIGHKR